MIPQCSLWLHPFTLSAASGVRHLNFALPPIHPSRWCDRIGRRGVVTRQSSAVRAVVVDWDASGHEDRERSDDSRGRKQVKAVTNRCWFEHDARRSDENGLPCTRREQKSGACALKRVCQRGSRWVQPTLAVNLSLANERNHPFLPGSTLIAYIFTFREILYSLAAGTTPCLRHFCIPFDLTIRFF